MFDRTLLEAAQLEFVAVADTHYMLDTTGQAVEFESRRKQTARAEAAFQQIQALAPRFVLHLGDVAQEYPETERYAKAIGQARQQLDTYCPARYHVVGNQDIGDKPDPTTPGLPVTQAALRSWEKHFGPTWFSFDQDDLHFVVINSQILNTDLPQAAQQRQWLEQDLADAAGKRIWLLLHLPLFLSTPDEPHLGHYDNVGQPDRAWLVGLIEQHNVEWMMSGHVHFPFYQRIGKTRYLISQATSFTRPGFSHLFTSSAPPERGRDQSPLLGFQLVRVMPDRCDVHLIRTSGATELPTPLAQGWQRVLTRLPGSLPEGQLGVTLNHPLSWQTQVPLAWPSAIRQPVRNDLPLLACLELGVRHVRVPVLDVEDALQRDRLGILRDEGVKVIATAMVQDETITADRLAAVSPHVDELELQTLGDELDDAALALLRACHDRRLGPVSLCPIVSRQPAPGKQHPRTRHGYLPDTLPTVHQALEQADLCVAGVVCRLDPSAPKAAAQGIERCGDLPRIGRVDLVSELAGEPAVRVAQAAEAMLQAGRLGKGRLYFEPLIDMDRTMDALPGLLDNQCNPNAVFYAIRLLNTLVSVTGADWMLLTRETVSRQLDRGPARVYRLEQALSRTCTAADVDDLLDLLTAGETLLAQR